MRGKTAFIYLGAFLVVVLVIVLMSSGNQSTDSSPNANIGNMPQDDVHQGLGGPAGDQPSGSNVMSSIKEKMDSLKNEADNNPKNLEKQIAIANFLTSAHQMKQSVEYYERALTIEPDNKDVLLQLTYVHFMMNEMDKSEEICNRLLKIDPKNPEAKYNLGVIYETKGDKESAKKMWTDVATMDTKSDVVEYAKRALEKLNNDSKNSE